jgi:hypothetical protein
MTLVGLSIPIEILDSILPGGIGYGVDQFETDKLSFETIHCLHSLERGD